MKKRFLMLFMMLLLSALVVTAAGYAWFTASAQAEIHGTRVKAETQGVLKVWTENGSSTANTYDNYTTYIDFSDSEDPFYNLAYTNYTMKDQSGNGAYFFETVANGAYENYGTVSGTGVALVYNLYFSAYTGNSTLGQTRDVFLSSMTVADVGTGELANSIRVGFLDNNNNIYGVYNPNSGYSNFVTLADYNSGNGAPSDGTPAGEIVAPVALGYVAPAAPTATSVRGVTVGTSAQASTICQIDAGEIRATAPTLKVVIWIEGSDSNTTDAKLSHEVTIDMIFQSRMPIDQYSLTTVTNGGSHTNPAIIYDSESAETPKFNVSDEYYLAAGTRSGYTFTGWFKDAGLTTQLPVETEGDNIGDWILVPGDFAAGTRVLTVYAGWQSNTEEFTITYNLDGGTNHVDNPASFVIGNLPITLQPATKDGSTFVEWNTQADGLGTTVTEITSVGDVTVYAIWTE